MKLAAPLWVANLFFLAAWSGFRADNVHSLNWEIVFMLTPYGLVHNLLLASDHYLKPYYANIPPTGGLDSVVVTAAIFHSLLSLYLLARLRERA